MGWISRPVAPFVGKYWCNTTAKLPSWIFLNITTEWQQREDVTHRQVCWNLSHCPSMAARGSLFWGAPSCSRSVCPRGNVCNNAGRWSVLPHVKDYEPCPKEKRQFTNWGDQWSAIACIKGVSIHFNITKNHTCWRCIDPAKELPLRNTFAGTLGLSSPIK